MQTRRSIFVISLGLLMALVVACKFSASTANISSLKIGKDKAASTETSRPVTKPPENPLNFIRAVMFRRATAIPEESLELVFLSKRRVSSPANDFKAA